MYGCNVWRMLRITPLNIDITINTIIQLKREAVICQLMCSVPPLLSLQSDKSSSLCTLSFLLLNLAFCFATAVKCSRQTVKCLVEQLSRHFIQFTYYVELNHLRGAIWSKSADSRCSVSFSLLLLPLMAWESPHGAQKLHIPEKCRIADSEFSADLFNLTRFVFMWSCWARSAADHECSLKAHSWSWPCCVDAQLKTLLVTRSFSLPSMIIDFPHLLVWKFELNCWCCRCEAYRDFCFQPCQNRSQSEQMPPNSAPFKKARRYLQ